MTGVVNVEILRRFHFLETVTAVVKRVTMCGTVPSGTRNGIHLMLTLRILIPMCIAQRELSQMLLFTIAL